MIQNLSKAIEYIDISKKNGVSIVSPYGHNGVHNDYFEALCYVHGNTRTGPYNSELVIYNEGLSVT